MLKHMSWVTVVAVGWGLALFYWMQTGPIVAIASSLIIATVGYILIDTLNDKNDDQSESIDADYCRLLEHKCKSITQFNEKLKNEKKLTELFLASMSHEIRTQLNGIIGLTELLNTATLDSESQEFVGLIKESADNLRITIDDILEISNLTSGKPTLQRTRFDIVTKTESAIGLFQAKVRENDVTLTSHIDPDIPRYVLGDPTRYAQILTSLIGNAVKYTPEKGRIDVSAELMDQNDKTVKLRIVVRDTGVGLTKQEQNALFDIRMQASTGETYKVGGTGLGLSITKKFVEAMGGTLSVESQKGKGTSFYLILEFTKSPQTVRQSAKKIDTKSTTDFKQTFDNVRVLVAEDNPVNQKLIRLMLEKRGVDVTLVENGKEALKARKQKFFHMIFMDIQMPVMNGEEATQAILTYENEHNLPHTPIVALTANALPGDKERYLKLGMDAYISKPIEFHEVETVIKQYCLQSQH